MCRLEQGFICGSLRTMGADRLPLIREALDVFLDEGVTALDLNEGEFGKSLDGMIVFDGDDDSVASLYMLLFAIENKDALALHEGPYL